MFFYFNSKLLTKSNLTFQNPELSLKMEFHWKIFYMIYILEEIIFSCQWMAQARIFHDGYVMCLVPPDFMVLRVLTLDSHSQYISSIELEVSIECHGKNKWNRPLFQILAAKEVC